MFLCTAQAAFSMPGRGATRATYELLCSPVQQSLVLLLPEDQQASSWGRQLGDLAGDQVGPLAWVLQHGHMSIGFTGWPVVQGITVTSLAW